MNAPFGPGPEHWPASVVSLRIGEGESLPVKEVLEKKARSYQFRYFKRAADLLLSVGVLVLVSTWLIPLLGLLVFLDLGFPLFFVQERVGRDNRRFRCYKLRTMYFCTTTRRQKASRFGRLLRVHKLDEIPQVLNVLKGEMSIVGPRPHMESDHEAFSRVIGETYHYRHLVKPGITGLAQVNGYEGPICSREKLRGRICQDLTYIRDWSWRLELTILLKTAVLLWSGLVQTRNDR